MLNKNVLRHELFKNIYEKFKNSTILIEACKIQKSRLITWLLSMEINQSIKDEEGMTALMYCVKYPSLSSFYGDLSTYDSMKIVDKNGNNVLFHSIYNGKALNFFLSINNKVKEDIINNINNDHDTVFLYCCRKNISKAIGYISYFKNINFHVQDKNGWTAIMYLVKHNNYRSISYVRNQKTDYIKSNDNETVISIMIKNFEKMRESNHPSLLTNCYRTLRMLIIKNYDFNIAIDDDGNSPLQYFIMIEDYCTVYYMIKNIKDLDLSFKNKHGDDAYSLVVKLNDKTLINFIASSGYKFDYVDKYNNNFVFYYVMKNDRGMVNFITTKNKDIINKTNDVKETPLIIATKLGYKDIVTTLLIKDADVNHQDYLGNTALHYAVDLSNHDIICLLIKYKGDPSIKNNRGKSVFDLANQLQDDYTLSILNHLNLPSNEKTLNSSERSYSLPVIQRERKNINIKSSSVDNINMRTININKYSNDTEFFLNNNDNIKIKYEPLPYSGVMRDIAIDVYHLDCKDDRIKKTIGVNRGRLIELLILQSVIFMSGLII
ncbi:ankyrin [Piromyces finnis]|uniref:Ankyrin n=1 Tax=Piromyces finnis TaxID=1754191 RepID=A0A1Y1V384_9FUNG|nr:ankyrin [Piromyces finnis]|eukprot:ORX44869.1 ankyrin [Piromyces finnis]